MHIAYSNKWQTSAYDKPASTRRKPKQAVIMSLKQFSNSKTQNRRPQLMPIRLAPSVLKGLSLSSVSGFPTFVVCLLVVRFGFGCSFCLLLFLSTQVSCIIVANSAAGHWRHEDISGAVAWSQGSARTPSERERERERERESASGQCLLMAICC